MTFGDQSGGFDQGVDEFLRDAVPVSVRRARETDRLDRIVQVRVIAPECDQQHLVLVGVCDQEFSVACFP